MVWSYTRDTVRLPIGNRYMTYGTWTSTVATTGGEVVTDLKRVDVFLITHEGAAVEAAVAVANETFPLASGSVTMVVTAQDTGTWLAIGMA